MASYAPCVTSTIATPPFQQRPDRFEFCRLISFRFGDSSPRSVRRAHLLGRCQLRKCLLLAEPGRIVLLRVDHDGAAHEGMALAAELGAQDLESPGSGWGEPVIGHRAGYHVHLGAEFGHVEI